MGRINLYKGLNEQYETFEANGKIKNIFPDLDFNHSVILKAGEKLSPDYEIQEEDILFIRVTPAIYGISVVGLIMAVVAAGVAVGAAAIALKNQQDAQKKLDEAQKTANELAQKLKQLPFLKGANNRTALGYSIPYVMGSTYHTPYLLTEGFYSIEGTDGQKQYWNAILVNGFNNQIIESVSIGNNSVLKGFREIEADGKTIKYIPEGSYDVDSSSVYYDEENQIEIIKSGESSISGLNQKVSSITYGEELKHAFGEAGEPIIKQLATNTMKVDICISFDGLRRYNDGWKSKSVTFVLEYSNNANSDTPTWIQFDTFTVERNTNETIRFQRTKSFTAEEAYGKDISVRITRTTACEETNSNETAYLLYINSWSYDPKKSTSSNLVACAPLENPWRDSTSRIAIKMISNESTKDSLDEINIMTYGLARIWDSDSEVWTSDKKPTRNPAAWILEILTSDAHAHSQYSDDEINKDALGALYEYCEENEFYCDGILDEASKKRDILSSILSECNSTMFINSEGLLDFAIDKEEDTPIALLNAQSVISVTVAKNFERKTEGKKVTFTNRDAWKVDNAYICLDGRTDSEAIYDSNSTLTEEALKYVTTYNHAWKLVHKQLAQEELQPREITVSVGQEGDYYPLYSLVMLQMKELLQGLSNGVIHKLVTSAGKIVGLELSDYVDLSDDSKRYGVIIQACSNSGKEHIYAEITGSGYTNKVYFTEDLEYSIAPSVNDIYSLGELDSNGDFKKITNLMKIYGIKPSNNNGWELTLRDYNSEIYSYGTIPAYKTNLTSSKEKATQLKAPTFGDINSIAGEYANATNAKVSKLFNSQLVQIYKESDSTLIDDTPNGALIYNFSSQSYSWENPDEGYPSLSNGWSWEYPNRNGRSVSTVYTSYATAQSQEVTASIASDDWSAPIPSGNDGSNGMNTYSITLYTREDDEPTYRPSELTYDFTTGNLSGSRNGWKLSIPSATENSSPCWEIHALAISEDLEAVIPSSKWSEPVQISAEGITEGQVREIVKEELVDVAETPNVYADYTSANFAVNSDRRTLKAQEVEINVKVVQTNEELDFSFNTEDLDNNLPEGWSYEIDYHTITLKVNSGVKITSGSFIIPIVYRSYRYNNSLGYTEGEETYTLGYDNLTLGYNVYNDDDTTYDIGFTYSGIIGGLYLGVISSVADIPSSNLTVGDYFTYTGSDTASTLSQEGSFKRGAVYFYSGDSNSWRWEKDEDINHISGVMSDIMSLANDDLERNNSKAYEYLNHLTANSIFVNLLTANEAFISKFVGNEAIIEGTKDTNYLVKAVEDSLTSAKSYADTASASAGASALSSAKTYSKGLSDDLISALSASEDKTVIEGGYIKTSLINTNALEILDSSGNIKTLLTAGKISTGLVSADSIEAGAVTTNKLKFDTTLYIGDNFTVTTAGKMTAKNAVIEEDCTVLGRLAKRYTFNTDILAVEQFIDLTNNGEYIVSIRGTVPRKVIKSEYDGDISKVYYTTSEPIALFTVSVMRREVIVENTWSGETHTEYENSPALTIININSNYLFDSNEQVFYYNGTGDGKYEVSILKI